MEYRYLVKCYYWIACRILGDYLKPPIDSVFLKILVKIFLGKGYCNPNVITMGRGIARNRKQRAYLDDAFKVRACHCRILRIILRIGPGTCQTDRKNYNYPTNRAHHTVIIIVE